MWRRPLALPSLLLCFSCLACCAGWRCVCPNCLPTPPYSHGCGPPVLCFTGRISVRPLTANRTHTCLSNIQRESRQSLRRWCLGGEMNTIGLPRSMKECDGEMGSFEPLAAAASTRATEEKTEPVESSPPSRRGDKKQVGERRHKHQSKGDPGEGGDRVAGKNPTGGQQRQQLDMEATSFSRWRRQQQQQPQQRQQQQRRLTTDNIGRQFESLGRSAETALVAAPVGKQRRASDVSSEQRSRQDSSRQRDSNALRRSSASAATATRAAASSTSGSGFFGSFDDSRYWDYAFRFTQRQDIGNQCRECKRPFSTLNEEIAVRR